MKITSLTKTAIYILISAVQLGSIYGHPESLSSEPYLQAKASSIELAQLVRFEIIQLPNGSISDRYYLGAEKAFKGTALSSPVDVVISASNRLPIGFSYIPTKVEYVLLVLSSDKAGTFRYAGTSSDQTRTLLLLDQDPTTFPDFVSLIRYLLESPIAKNNEFGLAFSRAMDDKNIKDQQIHFLSQGTQKQRLIAKDALVKDPSAISEGASDAIRPIVEKFLENWTVKWNSADLGGMRALLDRGALGQRRRFKISERIKKGNDQDHKYN
jgi:hypothetical protein